MELFLTTDIRIFKAGLGPFIRCVTSRGRIHTFFPELVLKSKARVILAVMQTLFTGSISPIEKNLSHTSDGEYGAWFIVMVMARVKDLHRWPDFGMCRKTPAG